jgi:15-cis-phytoene synthase
MKALPPEGGRELTEATHATIRAGSKSFALASILFGRREREGAWRLYAWCRYCDDVVDGQVLGHGMSVEADGAPERLADLRRLTRLALETDEPVPDEFQALREVAGASGVSTAQAMALLDGFAMDVQARRYRTLEDVLDYAFHVAGVVGIMMAEVMGSRDRETLRRACDLGLAFQLTNIARDVVEDAENGRLYLPADWLEAAGVRPEPAVVADPANRDGVALVAARLLAEADRYYGSARDGLPALPLRSAWAIASARGVYRAIGRVVRRRGARAWDRRAGASTAAKLLLLGRGGALALASRVPGRGRPREGLWTAPDALTAAGDCAPSAPRR